MLKAGNNRGHFYFWKFRVVKGVKYCCSAILLPQKKKET